ncbi:hypothetical protein ACO22_06274 [Paracoccidioides brasiliensis]|uniref:Probable 26S proteasome regulatory subunit p27 n=1 Tax=Paracoccidioides brasiliensis TaxID=121759 RepID=A0A1D2J7Y1_PARBR|nr:hypothetical protein ACO22_06274 [Paracoccidioides brasiliensis]
MGILMNNIHAPTVASGPTFARGFVNGRDLSSLSLNELYEEKRLIENELKALSNVLDSHGVTMSTSLTTFNGYPRDDLDIAQIRTTRARIIHLQNDYKDVMTKVEQCVHSRFAQLQQQQQQQQNANCPPSSASGTTTSAPDTPSTTSPGAEESASSQSAVREIPFAKINSVMEGSPAGQAGMKVGDLVRSFGHINWMNHENLTKVAEIVRTHEAKNLLVKLVRKNESGIETDITVTLVPRLGWGGRGYMGCHLMLA